MAVQHLSMDDARDIRPYALYVQLKKFKSGKLNHYFCRRLDNVDTPRWPSDNVCTIAALILVIGGSTMHSRSWTLAAASLLLAALAGCGSGGTGGSVEPSILSVTYKGNNNTAGSVPVDPTVYAAGDLVTVLGNTGGLLNSDATTTAYRFDGWNTQADGNGSTYGAGSTFTMGSAAVTLYAKWTAYALGDTGPAGGLIAFIWPDYSGGWRYLEAAPSDQSASATWSQGSTICSGFTAAGYADWAFPTLYQLQYMYNNLYNILTPVGGFTPDRYWSSTEPNPGTEAWYFDFSNATSAIQAKTTISRIRCARYF